MICNINVFKVTWDHLFVSNLLSHDVAFFDSELHVQGLHQHIDTHLPGIWLITAKCRAVAEVNRCFFQWVFYFNRWSGNFSAVCLEYVSSLSCILRYNLKDRRVETGHFMQLLRHATLHNQAVTLRVKVSKELWCSVGGGNKVIWLYQLSWKCKLATVTSCKADVLSDSPSSERQWGVQGLVEAVEGLVLFRCYLFHPK